MEKTMKLILKSCKNFHYAEATYSDGNVTVLKGSKINVKDNFPKMAAEAFAARHDRTIVNKKGITLKNITFASPSTAGQFVTGRSTNGNVAWRPDDKVSLAEFLGIAKPKTKKSTRSKKVQ